MLSGLAVSEVSYGSYRFYRRITIAGENHGSGGGDGDLFEETIVIIL
jgi:hypothetical protein